MILVDIGNSGLRAVRVQDPDPSTDRESSDLGDFGPGVIRLSWSASVASQHKPAPEQIAAPNQRWCNVYDPAAFDWVIDRLHHSTQESWFVSSVHRGACDLLQQRLLHRHQTLRFRTITWRDLPVPPMVEFPDKTGTDRLLAAYTAWNELNRKPSVDRSSVIVVQAGTAVTIDYTDADGAFLGGAIMPGLGLSLQLLAAGTDKLPWIANHIVEELPRLPGKNTTEAISAGVHAALVGGVRYAIQRYRDQLGDSIPVVVSGGDGAILRGLNDPTIVWIDNLVLRGLSLIAWNK